MGNNKSCTAPRTKVAKLTEDELSYYEGKTRFSAHEVLQLHNHFRRRCCADGSVEKEDFIDMFSNYIKSAKALLFLDHVFRTWDHEVNGNWKFEDFIQALSVTGRGTKQQRYEYLFRLYDADDSGEITIDEFSSSLKFRLKKVELADMEEIFQAIDIDGSGAIDIKEFVSACMTNTSLMEFLDLY